MSRRRCAGSWRQATGFRAFAGRVRFDGIAACDLEAKHSMVGRTLRRVPRRSDFFRATSALTLAHLVPWELEMSLGTILLIVLVLLLLGALPAWPYSTGWGYYPSGGLGLVLIVLLVLVVTGRL